VPKNEPATAGKRCAHFMSGQGTLHKLGGCSVLRVDGFRTPLNGSPHPRVKDTSANFAAATARIAAGGALRAGRRKTLLMARRHEHICSHSSGRTIDAKIV
jgi:hypothetical protein